MENLLDHQGFGAASGVVLHRRMAGEGDLMLTLFLKGVGMIRVSARGAATGRVRFGGGTEPLMWGNFGLYRDRGGSCRLKSVDVADDFLKLRGRAEALFAAVRWAKLLMRRLMTEHAANDLLANLYWNMKLLDDGKVPVEVVEWRFLWRWLKSWGLAPELDERFGRSPREIELLHWTAAAKASELAMLAGSEPGQTLTAHGRLFMNAARRAEGFLREV
jgi:DNA repair protein RecO (recombination protein O)